MFFSLRTVVFVFTVLKYVLNFASRLNPYMRTCALGACAKRAAFWQIYILCGSAPSCPYDVLGNSWNVTRYYVKQVQRAVDTKDIESQRSKSTKTTIHLKL